MPNDSRDPRPDSPALFPAWGLPATEAYEDLSADAGLWLTGGVALLAWTGLALLLTA